MKDARGELFLVEGSALTTLPAREYREGILASRLEGGLAGLLEAHPNLVPGDQVDPGNAVPPRFAVLRREIGLGSGSLDLLLVDNCGVLTLAETKLHQNPESHREVVGQILEYASHVGEAWTSGLIREKAADYWAVRGASLDVAIKSRFGEEFDVENLWADVERNMRAGWFRLLIVGDEIRPVARRIIEFLNVHLPTLEILGVEIRCYGTDPNRLVVAPRVIGQTQVTADRKSATVLPTRRWSLDDMRELYESIPDAAVRQRMKRFLDLMIQSGLAFSFDTARRQPKYGLRGSDDGFLGSVEETGGRIYLRLADRFHVQTRTARDALMETAKRLRLVEERFDASKQTEGRGLLRTLADLSDDEAAELSSSLVRLFGDTKGQEEGHDGHRQEADHV